MNVCLIHRKLVVKSIIGSWHWRYIMQDFHISLYNILKWMDKIFCIILTVYTYLNLWKSSVIVTGDIYRFIKFKVIDSEYEFGWGSRGVTSSCVAYISLASLFFFSHFQLSGIAPLDSVYLIGDCESLDPPKIWHNNYM